MAEKIKCDCGVTFEVEEGQTHCNYCGIKLSDIGKEKPVGLAKEDKATLSGSQKKKVILVNPLNESVMEEVKTDGWSWGAFLLGPIWYCYKGLWGEGFLYFILIFVLSWTIIVPIILWFVMALRFNQEYYKFLFKKGYKLKAEGKELIEERIRANNNTQQNNPLNDLEKLAELKDKGVVTEEEFQQKKREILRLPPYEQK